MKKLLAALALLALCASAAVAQTPSFPQTLPANSVVGRLGIGPGPAQAIPFSTFIQQISPSTGDAVISIKDFGAKGDGTTDDTAAIQAAIDCSFGTGTGCSANNHGVTFCPAGVYKISLPLFVDPPGNLRGTATAWSSSTTYASGNIVRFNGVPFISLQNGNTNHSPSADVTFLARSGPVWWQQTTATPSVFTQQSVFYGQKGLGNIGNSHGCTIKPAFNGSTWMWLSTGQGNYVSDVAFVGPGFFSGWGCTLWTDGTGISIPGGGAGASFSKVENVSITGIYSGVRTGQNQDSLADSNTLSKVSIRQTCIGAYFSETQNQINSIYDSNISGAFAGVYAPSNTAVKVYGGNYSPTDEAGVNGAMTIGSTSSLTRFTQSDNGYGYRFTTTVSSPDLAMQQCQYAQCPYDSFMLNTANLGIIGLTLTAFNASTNVASFDVLQSWSSWMYWQVDGNANADLQAEIQAATTLYAAQKTTIFRGCSIAVYGTFIETNDAPYELAGTYCGFGSSIGISIDHAPLGDASILQRSALAGYTGSGLSAFLAANAFPFVSAQQGPVSISNIQIGTGGSNGSLIWEVQPNQRVSLTGNSAGIVVPNIRTIGSNGGDLPECSAAWVCGTWDPNVFVPRGPETVPLYLTSGSWAVPYKGWYPAPYTIPRLSVADITTLGSLPAITQASVGYPMMAGPSIYQVVNSGSGGLSSTHLFAKSSHSGFTYGQNLTTSNISGSAWSYKGQSKIVYMSTNLLGMMFPGLVIGLNNGGGNVYYTVTGVYPQTCKGGSCATYTGYVTVGGFNTQNSTLLAGTKTTVYTGTTVTQQALAITQTP